MPRPFCRKRIAGQPRCCTFLPKGVTGPELEEIVVTLDELESIRLVDLLGLYQEQASAQMNVSRPTLGRILERAHHKIADALYHGKALRIQGGCVELRKDAERRCPNCRRLYPPLGGRETGCPHCHAVALFSKNQMDKENLP